MSENKSRSSSDLIPSLFLLPFSCYIPLFLRTSQNVHIKPTTQTHAAIHAFLPATPIPSNYSRWHHIFFLFRNSGFCFPYFPPRHLSSIVRDPQSFSPRFRNPKTNCLSLENTKEFIIEPTLYMVCVYKWLLNTEWTFQQNLSKNHDLSYFTGVADHFAGLPSYTSTIT